MKQVVFGSALAALFIGGAANAADMRVRPVAAPPVALATWTGCHVGGHVGNEWGRHDGYSTRASAFGTPGTPIFAPLPNGTQVTDRFNMDGFIGGGYVGCDYQAGAWVFGIEGDWSKVNKEGQAFYTGPAILANAGTAGGTVLVNPFNAFSAKERWIATLRGRLGYSVDKWLFYVTGGAAWVKIDDAAWLVTSPINTAILQTSDRTGWTVGAGLDYALFYGWSVKTEYLYVQVASYDTFNPGTGNGTIANAGRNLTNLDSGKISNHIFKSGLTYKFW
jgi:outer membrane immunogenic protein